MSVIFAFYPGLAAAGDPGTLIVKLAPGGNPTRLSNFAENVEYLFPETYRLKVQNMTAALAALAGDEGVEYAEADARLRAELNANDPYFVLDQKELARQWYLPKIKIHEAWEKTTGAGITIAVIDTGIDAKHQDLNDGRVVGGYLSYCQVAGGAQNDCLVRVTGDIAPGVNSDDNGHGTIIAGILGAIQNNNKGIAGINWNVRLMPVKALDSTGSGLASDVAAGIRWAADNGARIINLSIGGSGLLGIQVLEQAISYAFNKGVLIVAAAGNDAAITGGNLNLNPSLPVCADGGENMVVGVAAVDVSDQKAKFSNFGSNCIDIAAPGAGTFVDKQQKQGLVSTYYDPTRPGEHDLYVYAVGTSVATPMVSGVAALLMSILPDLDVKAVRDRLIASVDNIDQFNQTGCNGATCVGQIGRGRLNALKAVSLASVFPAGALVKSIDGHIFLIERGLKRTVSEFVYNQRFAGTLLINADGSQLDNFPAGLPLPPADGTLIKDPDSALVYLVEGGERQPLSYLSFISRALIFADVKVLPAGEVASYPLGVSAAVLDGALVKAPDHPAVYIMNGGVRRLLSWFVFQQRGFLNLPIATLSPDELSSYPAAGNLYAPLDGTLIRGDKDQTVFVIEGGRRRGLNLAAFEARGYRFVDVKILSQSEADAYELGESIIN